MKIPLTAVSLTLVVACSSNGLFEASPEEADATATVDVTAASHSAAANTRTSAPVTASRSQPEGSYEATVRVSKEADSEERRMAFRGVTLDRAGKPHLVVSYLADDLWRAFDGKRVWVKSTPYEPKGRAIGGEHANVDELWLVEETADSVYVSFGEGKSLEGELKESAGEKGSKSEGSTATRFVDRTGTVYGVLHLPEGPSVRGKVKIIGRAVGLSKFAAHESGPQLWITRVEAL